MKDEKEIQRLKIAIEETVKLRSEAYERYKFYKAEYYRLIDQLVEVMDEK